MKIYIFLISLVFSINITFGQKSIEKAHEYKQRGEYSNAIKEFKKALRADLLSAEISKIYFNIGNCYNKIKDYDSAIKYYEKSIETAEANKLIYYQLAEVLLGKCLYEEALDVYLKLLDTDETGDTDLDLDSDAQKRITMTREAIPTTQKDIGKVSITGMNLFNSEYSEFGLYYNNRTIYFASMRRGMISKKDVKTIQGFSKIYSSSLIQDKHKAESKQTTKYLPVSYHFSLAWTRPNPLPSPFNSKRYNDGNMTIDHTINTAYVTQCRGTDGNCKILSVDFDEDFNSKNALPINISSDNYSTGHPTITSDGKTMFFVSDMPGGYGETDIWISHKQDDGNWSTPINAGPIINTSKNEMFPYLYQDSMLIFSSDEHLGYGGLDLFYSLFTSKKDFTEPVNFGTPINSGADDFSLIISQELRGGFFCSNRPGGIGNDDIYHYSGMPFRIVLRGLVTDEKTSEPISGASVLYSVSKMVPDTIYSDANGTFTLFLQSGQKYTFDIFKDGYSNIRTFYTYGTDITSILEEYYLDVVLFPSKTGISVEGFVMESETKEPFVDQKIIIVGDEGYYDQTKTNIIGYYSFHDLKDETKYTLIMAKEGFWTQTKVLEIPKLSRPKVFSALSDYDSDFYAKVIDLKEIIILYDIYYNYDKADLLETSKIELDKIVNLLRENPNLTVELSSHCDERGSHEYNDDLSQRRAQSVVDYLVNNNISKNKLIARGFGKKNLLIKNAQTKQEHQLNRRTCFRVLQIGEHDYNLIVESIAPMLPPIPISKKKIVESKKIILTEEDKTTEIKEFPVGVTPYATHISSGIIYKVQILATRENINDYSYFIKATQTVPGLSIIQEKHDDGWIRYYAGVFNDSNKAVELREKLKKAGYEDCFISVFRNE